jgi:hypothetical protein
VEYSALLDQLWARNELDAAKFAAEMRGTSSADLLINNVWPILQLVAEALLLGWLVKKLRAPPARWYHLSNSHWRIIRWTCYCSAAIWLVGGGVTLSLRGTGGDQAALLTLHSIFVSGFGGLTIVLGLALLARWLWIILHKSSVPPEAL